MSIEYKSLVIEEDPDKGILTVSVSGKLEREDYDVLGTEFDRMVTQHGPIRLLVELKDFHGWTAGAAWEDAKLGFRHYSDIDRLAIVGENRWQEGMTKFVKPFTRAEVKYFDTADAEAAGHWVQG